MLRATLEQPKPKATALTNTLIPHSTPAELSEAIDSFERVLASGFHGRGVLCAQLERELAAFFGLPTAHLCASGTTALELAFRALQLEGKRIALPSLTCAAVLHAVRGAGATPIFYDHGYTAPLVTDLPEEFDAVVVVPPPNGMPGDWSFKPFGLLGVPVIADLCQQWVSASADLREADAVVISTYATKLMSTGNGGAVLSSDEELMEMVRQLNTHDQLESLEPQRVNYPFDDVRATLGLDQIQRMDDLLALRRSISEAYDQAFGQESPPDGVVYRYLLECSGADACDALGDTLASAGIEAKRPVFRPLHKYFGFEDADFPRASAAWEKYLSLPCYPSLTVEEQDRVIEAVLGFRQATES